MIPGAIPDSVGDVIVTCPGCGSKYRVRNESVPTDGARMRCPKCDTLFLARPPSAAEQASSMHDDPSSMFQQLDPARTGSGAIPSLPPQQTPAAPLPTPGVPQQPQASGPITALFQAFDPGALPPEAQRPPPPQPQPASSLGCRRRRSAARRGCASAAVRRRRRRSRAARRRRRGACSRRTRRSAPARWCF
jgi:predicted Zn finger-like uncharacterized protein